MLTKDLRIQLLNLIYQAVFWDWTELPIATSDWEEFLFSYQIILADKQNLNQEEKKILLKLYQLFFKNQPEYQVLLSSHLKDWRKTYKLARSCLFSFQVEKDFLKQQNLTENIVGKYIKLSQEYIGGESVSLVHAVLVKLEGKDTLVEGEGNVAEEKETKKIDSDLEEILDEENLKTDEI